MNPPNQQPQHPKPTPALRPASAAPHPATPAIAQTATPARPAPSDSLRLRYVSNPFRNTMRALGITFQTNPISSLTIVPLLMVAFLVLIVPGLLLMALAGPIIGALVAGVGVTIWATLMTAAIITVAAASYHGTTITGKQALQGFDKAKLPTLLLILILSSVASIIAAIFFIIPGIFVAARLALAPFVMYEEKLGAMASLKRSWKLTNGHVWEILGTYAAQIALIGISGGLLSYVGSYAGLIDRYYTLKAHEKAGIPTGPTHYSNYLLTIFMILGIAAYFALVSAGGFMSGNADETVEQTTTPTVQQFPSSNDFQQYEGIDDLEPAPPSDYTMPSQPMTDPGGGMMPGQP